ncbi:ABC transporter substrate-binding protein [Comamonas flocculans]|uniref:ABC transporter substrate-binding protein n=1 Tax=Comamonas flocculans TaxID=2597701 RepID=A0A5B8S172_9BURK|nr:ABC transporter substrate-binding protein [Comamonas flocculans]
MFHSLPRWGRAGVGACLALCLLAAAQAYEITDDAGQRQRFDAAPARIVSLLPSLTETVCALGACDRLVGVDRYSNWPESVQRLPNVGGGLDPNIEAVVALKPDVVLIGTSSRASVRLRALGLKVLALEPKTRAAMRHTTELLGELLQVGGALALLARIDAGVQAAAASVPPGARGQRVYYEITPAPHAAGRGTFIDELIEALGLVNIMDPALGPYPKINPELVVRLDPDLIMVSQQGAAELARRPGWARLRALRRGKVCEFNADERNILVRPGPRMPEAARLMADCAARGISSEK